MPLAQLSEGAPVGCTMKKRVPKGLHKMIDSITQLLIRSGVWVRVGESVGGQGESPATNAFRKDEEGRPCHASETGCESAASRRQAYRDVLLVTKVMAVR